jgi:endonuclease YncB( thermonuclease family)
MQLNHRTFPLLQSFFVFVGIVSFCGSACGQSSSPPEKLQIKKSRYESQCGSPFYESMAWASVTGKVIEVIDGRTFTILLDDKTKRRVSLAAIAAPNLKEESGKVALKALSDLVLDKKVMILVNPSKAKTERFTGALSSVIEKLIEAGLVRYQQPEPYTISNYSACVYRQLEAEAQTAKRGLWQ